MTCPCCELLENHEALKCHHAGVENDCKELRKKLLDAQWEAAHARRLLERVEEFHPHKRTVGGSIFSGDLPHPDGCNDDCMACAIRDHLDRIEAGETGNTTGPLHHDDGVQSDRHESGVGTIQKPSGSHPLSDGPVSGADDAPPATRCEHCDSLANDCRMMQERVQRLVEANLQLKARLEDCRYYARKINAEVENEQ